MAAAIRIRTIVSVACVFLVSGLLLVGCASYNQTQILPENAVNVLRVGDEVDITRIDGSKVSFKIKAIEDGEVIGKKDQVLVSDIAAITLYVQDVANSDGLSDGTYEVLGWIGAILIWGAIL
jgi:hypothetical protein